MTKINDEEIAAIKSRLEHILELRKAGDEGAIIAESTFLFEDCPRLIGAIEEAYREMEKMKVALSWIKKAAEDFRFVALDCDESYSLLSNILFMSDENLTWPTEIMTSLKAGDKDGTKPDSQKGGSK